MGLVVRAWHPPHVGCIHTANRSQLRPDLHAACKASSPGFLGQARLSPWKEGSREFCGRLSGLRRVPGRGPQTHERQARQGPMGPTIPSEAKPAWPRLAPCSAWSCRWVSLLQRCFGDPGARRTMRGGPRWKFLARSPCVSPKLPCWRPAMGSSEAVSSAASHGQGGGSPAW